MTPSRHRRPHHRTHRHPRRHEIPVEAWAPSPDAELGPFSELVLGVTMDQRAFGPRRLLVIFGSLDDRFVSLQHCPTTQGLDNALLACLWHFDVVGRGGERSAVAVALSDEAVVAGPPPEDFLLRFEAARAVAADAGVHLLDWVACDDEQFRFARMRPTGPLPDPGWWDVPQAS